MTRAVARRTSEMPQRTYSADGRYWIASRDHRLLLASYAPHSDSAAWRLVLREVAPHMAIEVSLRSGRELYTDGA